MPKLLACVINFSLPTEALTSSLITILTLLSGTLPSFLGVLVFNQLSISGDTSANFLGPFAPFVRLKKLFVV